MTILAVLRSPKRRSKGSLAKYFQFSLGFGRSSMHCRWILRCVVANDYSDSSRYDLRQSSFQCGPCYCECQKNRKVWRGRRVRHGVPLHGRALPDLHTRNGCRSMLHRRKVKLEITQFLKHHGRNSHFMTKTIYIPRRKLSFLLLGLVEFLRPS